MKARTEAEAAKLAKTTQRWARHGARRRCGKCAWATVLDNARAFCHCAARDEIMWTAYTCGAWKPRRKP